MGSEVSIASARDEDIDAVVELLDRQLLEHGVGTSAPKLRHAVAAVLEDKRLGFILTARMGASIVGCACISYVWSMEHAGRAAWLEEMYVIPGHRSAGVGEALLIEALRRAAAERCSAMDLEVDGSHARASNLYERRGFVRLGRARWVKRLDRAGE